MTSEQSAGWHHLEAVSHCNAEYIDPEIIRSAKPVLLKGLVNQWPAVQACHSAQAAIQYIKSQDNGAPTMVYQGEPDIQGQYGYDASGTALNYQSVRGTITSMLDDIEAHIDSPQPPSRYVASNHIASHLPDFIEHNHIAIPTLPLADTCQPPLASIWIGNRSTARCHFDALENIACCVAGERRFTLFPPEQIANLYPGPLHITPGGQPISLVDIHHPDYEQFPNFKLACAEGFQVTLQPGDGIYIPAMWWHQVEGLSPFNVMVNYWWNRAPMHLSGGMSALLHGLLAIRDKAPHEKAAWRAFFDYYVFGDAAQTNAHIPLQAQGVLAPLEDNHARQLRALLMRQLNR